MKKTLLLVFGGFVLILCVFALFSNLFTQELHKNHTQLLLIDDTAEKLQVHKERILKLSQHGSLFDSIALSETDCLASSYRFYDSLFRFRPVEDQKPSAQWKERVQNAMNDERRVLVLSARIGFKEEGILGKMRTVIHTAEAMYPGYKAQILSLRRHEKDYIMRLDEHYAKSFNDECEALKQSGIQQSLIEEYQYRFNEARFSLDRLYVIDLAAFPEAIHSIERVQKLVRYYRSSLLRKNTAISNKALYFQIITSIIFVVILLAISFWLIQRYANQVKMLRLAMDGFIRSNYETRSYFNERLPKNEIGLISKHFIQLARKIQGEVKYLEENVLRRTQTLYRKNEQLEKQHKEIVESLHYAQNLQQSLLVSRRSIEDQFREALVYYEPKNLVGGDFYWMKEYKRGNAEFVLFALADCTGHGVPGALISVLGMNTLDELSATGLLNPAALLNQLRITIGKRFSGDGGKRLDGMDISIFQLNKRTGKLTFSGAHMPLWILRGKNIIELKGQRIPIGVTYGETEEFYNQGIQLEAGDRLLLFSDGVTDQFGGSRQKKWGKNGFRELLQKKHLTSTHALFTEIITSLENWKGTTEQTDDCSLVLLEVKLQLPTTSDKLLVTSDELLITSDERLVKSDERLVTSY